MPIDAIIRVSFETSSSANQAANKALTGDPAAGPGSGPFVKHGTAAFTCFGGAENAVGNAIAQLGSVLQQHAGNLDFVSISVVRRK